MKRETIIWSILLVVIGAALLIYALQTGAGNAYVRAQEQAFYRFGEGEDEEWVELRDIESLDYSLEDAQGEPITWTDYDRATPSDYFEAEAATPGQAAYRFSLWQTIGTWVAAFFTLAILSFLYKDNPFYKIAESCVVGISAAYWMVVGFWDVIVPNLLGELMPGVIKAWAVPGTELPETPLWQSGDWWFTWVPFVLGLMLLWRLSPKGGWISRWPMAFVIGVFCGIRLMAFIHADFLAQIRNSIVPFYVLNDQNAFDFWDSTFNLIMVASVLACLTYFFFSIEHRGFVGQLARGGMWVLMITFGAAFGYTVMGRIALLAIRLEFLFDDWLWLIDPTGNRTLMEAAALLWHGPLTLLL